MKYNKEDTRNDFIFFLNYIIVRLVATNKLYLEIHLLLLHLCLLDLGINQATNDNCEDATSDTIDNEVEDGI